ncbi:hypothetical protein EDB81DRAFT_895846 [Dactylonectria macrodidyma]|uniref:DUF6546 domain-containing protein n=1 Tax=Dactylonectria macrodidyma TaxID=307937 RepID=A0A9P9JQH6_9HYPO|nr:hypothetical protein EDB81DRAFT_895846 [Dactylonectria macrodidyma]
MNVSTARPSWGSLPPETRLMILQYVIPKYGHLFEFEKAVQGDNVVRLNYIKHLRLHIKLAEYTNRTYDKPESTANISKNSRSFTHAMVVLLNALSSWQGISGGLTLEVIANSPSDVEYHPKEFRLLDNYPFRFEEDLDRSPNYSQYYRQKNEEDRERRSNITRRLPRRVRHGMAVRLRGTPLELQPWLFRRRQGCGNLMWNLPVVPIVKGLLLREEFRRGIALTSLAKLCRDTFVALESFKLRSHLIPALPASVDRFVFLQERRRYSIGNQLLVPVLTPLAWDLALSCHRFIEFVPPHGINMDTFLTRLVQHGKCESSKLQHLCLRAGPLLPSTYQYRVTVLLALAGEAAIFFPRLRILELWNSDYGFAYLFRYAQDDFEATITWRCAGTEFVLEPKVIDQWAKVASTRTLAVNIVPFTEADGDGSVFQQMAIIRHLALRKLAFDPITEAQRIAEVSAGQG